MAGVRGGWARSRPVAMETMSFPVGSYLKSETDAVSNIRTHEQLTLTKKGIVGAKLNAVDRVTQCYKAELLHSLLFHSVQVFNLPPKALYCPSSGSVHQVNYIIR